MRKRFHTETQRHRDTKKTRKEKINGFFLLCVSVSLCLCVLFFGANAWGEEPAPAPAAPPQACMDCHRAGNGVLAPVMELPAYAAHSGLQCRDCHPGDGMPPCPPSLPPVKCDLCHQDEVKALGKSSHGKKMAAHIKETEKKDKVKLQEMCAKCHERDAHHLRKKEDALSSSNRLNVYKTCLECHHQIQPIAIDSYVDSIHGVAASGGNIKSAVCIDCHGSHFIEGMELDDSSVFRDTVPETCSKCHPLEYSEYVDSKHWKSVEKGFKEAPICTSCHGEHGIKSRRDPASPSWVGNITRTCASCHESELINAKFMLPEGMVQSFLDSYHGLSGSLGDIRAASCSSCHGNHNILPSSDPRSSVSSQNLGKTCGGCHPGAEKRFILEPIHKEKKNQGHWIVGLVRDVYILLILGTIGSMLAHNALDLFFKSTRGEPYERAGILSPRFSINERIQHGLLAVAFIALAYSGFVLSLPDSIIALPFQYLPDGADLRRWTHRGAAGLMIAASLYHVIYLAFTERGRQQAKNIFPRLQDVIDVKNVMFKYFGRATAELHLPHYTYVEKAEYWALIWGNIVMGATGLCLMFTDVVLSWAPLWVVDLAGTIHFYEAVLAVSAIVVWHGYWVVFDPSHYPMNLTWLFGNPRREPGPHPEPAKSPGESVTS